MAEVKSIAKSIRISPRKTRLVVDLIRGKKVGDAIAILHNCESPVKNDVLKVLNSAIANAKHLSEVKEEFNIELDKLFVKEILVDQGATLKRFRPRAKGSGNRILKRTSHITVVVSDGLE